MNYFERAINQLPCITAPTLHISKDLRSRLALETKLSSAVSVTSSVNHR